MDFLLFFVILFLIDTYVHLQGHDTFFWTYKTEAEKEIQKIRIEKLKNG